MEQVFNNKNEKIEYLTRNGYEVKIGELLREAFDIFKKNPGGYIGFFILTMLISGALGFIPLVGTLVNWVISPALSFGYVIVSRKIKYNEPYTFSNFFDGFHKFGPLFVGTLLAALMIILGFICLVIPGIYLAVCYSFASYFIWYNMDNGYWDALEKCRKFITKRWWQVFVLFLAILGVNILGVICLVVGLLVSIPVSIISIYVFYENTIGTQEEEKFDFEKEQEPGTTPI